MKIVITKSGDCLIVEGINVFIFELADALIQLGHEVSVLSSFAGSVSGATNIDFEKNVKEFFSVKTVPSSFVMSSKPLWRSRYSQLIQENLLFTLKAPRLINKISPSMVIFNGATTTICNCFKVIVNVDMEYQLSKHYNQLVYRNCDKIVATSSELKTEIIRQLHFSDSKVSVIPICINTRNFVPRPLHDRSHAILHIGSRLHKRPDVTIAAFEKIAEIDPKVRLYIVGPIAPSDEILLARVQRLKTDIRERITFIGKCSKQKLIKLYSQIKVTSVPSNYGFPICSPTALESLAAGTPVVGSFSAISGDNLVDGYNGFRVPSHNVDLFASRLKLLLDEEDIWEEMSRNALQHIKCYDKITVARDYISLYEKFAR